MDSFDTDGWLINSGPRRGVSLMDSLDVDGGGRRAGLPINTDSRSDDGFGKEGTEFSSCWIAPRDGGRAGVLV